MSPIYVEGSEGKARGLGGGQAVVDLFPGALWVSSASRESTGEFGMGRVLGKSRRVS